MSPLSCFLVLSVTLINVKQAWAECTTPDNFLPYGLSVGDTEVAFTRDSEFYTEEIIYHAPFNVFGSSAPDTKIKFTRRRSVILRPEPDSASTSGIQLVPREGYPTDGDVYYRHNTNESDLNIVNSMACGPFDGVIIITYACVGAAPEKSYQLLFAYGPQKTIAIFNYELPYVYDYRWVLNLATEYHYPLNETDIADDGITIIDLTNATTQGGGAVLPVETGGPCEGTSSTCSVYADGRVQTLNGSTVSNELTLEQNFVATVDKAEKNKNNDPCKFFLMIRTNESYEPINYIRIALGVHPENTRKYLRKFQFPLTSDSYVKEFGYNLSSANLLYQADMPYAMDDTGSVEALGITVEVTDANDGWIIKSATCGYSFTHLWTNQEPIVTMTLEGNRYDGRILETCAGM